MPLDDSFELGIFVAGPNEEEPGVGTHAAIGLRVDGDLLCAAGVGALADVRRLGRSGAVALLEARDVLVHLAEERFVAGSPLLPERRHRPPTTLSVTRPRPNRAVVLIALGDY